MTFFVDDQSILTLDRMGPNYKGYVVARFVEQNPEEIDGRNFRDYLLKDWNDIILEYARRS